jgi:RHS repeat-associated protein
VYDGATGDLARRDDATDPLAPSMLWQVDAREVDGSLAHATYGTGGVDVALTRQYDPATGRLEHIDMRAIGAGGAASPQHAMTYGYSPGGAALERIDEVAQRREVFGYDASDRLTSWTVESLTGAFPMRQTVYDFDDLGNLEQVIENGLVVDTMTYGWGGKPHVLASKNGQAYGYDAKGRQVDGPERTIGFSASDLPKKVQTKGSLGTTTTYTYDAGGTRVRKRTPSEETTYVGGLYEQRKALANGPQTEHVFYVPGESGVALQVTYEEATGAERRDVVAEDALGTVSGVIDAAGVVSEKRYYDPYGKKVLADGSAAPTNGPVSDLRRGFTGHEEDAESGLTNMRGRMYDPGQRRFVTPDPFVSDPFFGQGLNRYAYVTNNPLRWVDPSGFEQESVSVVACGGSPRPECQGFDQQPDVAVTIDLTPSGATPNPTTPQKADGPGTEPPPIGPPAPPVEAEPTPAGAQEMAMRHQYQEATSQGQGGAPPSADGGGGFRGSGASPGDPGTYAPEVVTLALGVAFAPLVGPALARVPPSIWRGAAAASTTQITNSDDAEGHVSSALVGTGGVDPKASLRRALQAGEAGNLAPGAAGRRQLAARPCLGTSPRTWKRPLS